jgi:hypothetical protein
MAVRRAKGATFAVGAVGASTTGVEALGVVAKINDIGPGEANAS